MYACIPKKALKYRKQIELKGEIDKSTIIVEDFNTALSVITELLNIKSARI